jgi:hypothetical protein
MGFNRSILPPRRLVGRPRAVQNDMQAEDGKEGPDPSYDPPSRP